MTLKFHNTLTKTVEDFEPISDREVKLYTCGPTVYGYLHVGNWAAYIYWDILVRVLQANEYKVVRVMNITDVGHLVSDADEGEDKLEKGARREGKTAWEVANFYTKDFIDGMNKLGLIEPEHLTRATDFIDQQLDLVRTLKQKGFTYQIEDGIYFDTSKFPAYANFARLDLEGLRAGARVDYNTQKRNPTDFALWKFTPAGEKRDMEWATPEDLVNGDSHVVDSEKPEQSRSDSTSAKHLQPESDQTLGLLSDPERSRFAEIENEMTNTNSTIMGFPGWHLECSAMAMSVFGPTLDIHTGGIDHIPVHHTNEIAQSEAATGKQFSRFWLHNNHITVDDTKISKSLDNGYTLDDLKEKGFNPLDYRMFVLQSHYRSAANFTFDNLTAAKNRLRNWRAIAVLRHQTHTTITNTDKDTDDRSRPLYGTSSAVKEALNNDLGTPQALTIIDQAFNELVDLPLERINRNALIALLETVDDLLGLKLINSTPDIEDNLKQTILARQHARNEKNWKLADELRIKLEKDNIIVRDTLTGTVWQYT